MAEVRTINDGPVVDIAIDKLVPHPRNANLGDLPATADSIEANGFYGAIIVQRSTGQILAGNHRYRVAKDAGARTIPVQYVNVDDATALRILVADNRTTRLGSDEPTALVQLLSELNAGGSLVGTGWNNDGLADLMKSIAGPLDLDGMHKTYGESTPESLWPIVRVQVPPAVHEAYLRCMDALGDDPEPERFARLVAAAEPHLAASR